MDWLDAFDPGAPKSNNKSQHQVWNRLSHEAHQSNQISSESSTSSSAAAGPSAPGPPTPSGRITRTFDFSACTGTNALTARPRPPRPGLSRPGPSRRNRAAPPSAALRSEDAQPNENQTRAKPWEISAPPSIGMAKSRKNSARPPHIPTGPAQTQPSRPFPLPQRPPPYNRGNISHPPVSVYCSTALRPPAGAPTYPLPKDQREKLKEQQKQKQQARQRDQQPAKQPPPKKPRLDNAPSSLLAEDATLTEPSTVRDQLEQSRLITIDDVNPNIRLWPHKSRTEAERLIANAKPGPTPAISVNRLRESLNKKSNKEVHAARSQAGEWLKRQKNFSDSVCLAIRNCRKRLLTLLQIRVELYHCAAKLLPCPPPGQTAEEERAYVIDLVNYARNVYLELLGLKTSHINAAAFNEKEMALRPNDPIIVNASHQIRDVDDIGCYALQVIEHYVKTFGPRIFDLSWNDIERWKRQNMPYSNVDVASDNRPDSTQQLDISRAVVPQVDAPSTLPLPSAEHTEATTRDTIRSEAVLTPPPSPPRLSQPETAAEKISIATKASVRSPSVSPKLAQLIDILSIFERTLEPTHVSSRQHSHEDMLEEARQAEELARYLEQLSDAEPIPSAAARPLTVPAPVAQALTESRSTAEANTFSIKAEKLEEVDELLDEGVSDIAVPETLQCPPTIEEGTDDDDEDDRPLAEALSLTSLARHPSSTDSDPEENIPLRDLLYRQSSATPSVRSTRGRNEDNSTWPSMSFEPKVLSLKQFRAFSGAPGMSIKYFVPVASAAMDAQASVRSRANVFDAAIGVSEHGRIAMYAEEQATSSEELDPGLPRKLMQFQARDSEGKGKGEKSFSPIDRVEDVSRLTSKVCGIASSTKKLLGLGNHNAYPSQVSLVTVDDAGRACRTYHLDERPHTQGAASISHFPRTDPDKASSIDFATGGMDGIVNHWRWKARPTRAETQRLHTLHDGKPVVALEHLSSRSNILASASIGTVIGYDLGALTLGFSWNTSDRIVHLQRTPDPKLMLGILARRDYDQFRMFDITGRNGPISRPVISFGWLNDAEGKLPLGRGTFHPTRRAIFAHGAEDGHVRVWDMRNARDPLIDERLGDEPIVQAVWTSSTSGDDEDNMYVATTKGVRSISLLAR
ncbi:hypothetical protein NDA18_004763 [Ustilago nuda]|nr:hypothetical protein NDA18_004763 [Ustilago nuda]